MKDSAVHRRQIPAPWTVIDFHDKKGQVFRQDGNKLRTKFMLHCVVFSGSQTEDMFWATFRYVNTENQTMYDPNLKVLLDMYTATSTLANEFVLRRSVVLTERLQRLAITEEQQVLMRAICCLASGALRSAE